MISDSRSFIDSPQSGHSFAGIDISLIGTYGTSSPMRGHTSRPFDGNMLTAATDDQPWNEARVFADEVIVDFPSVAPAVDRIRHSFLADERAATSLQAAIELSYSDASAGVTVPLSVNVRRTCGACGGRGGSWCDACAHCSGTGTELVPHQLQVTVPAGVSDGAKFHFTVKPPDHHPTRIQLRISVS